MSSPLFISSSTLFSRPVFAKRRPSSGWFCSLSSEQHVTPSRKLRPTNHLVQFKRSRFVAYYNELKRLKQLPPGVVPDAATALSAALTACGRRHERKVMQYLTSLLGDMTSMAAPCSIPFNHPERHALTRKAIEDRAPLIQGAALCDGVIDGYADVLIRSDLDPFVDPHVRRDVDLLSYSVIEIKFAKTQTPEHLLQIASYYSLLDKLLRDIGCASGAARAYLWLGSTSNVPVSLPGRALLFLHEHASADFSHFLQHFPSEDDAPSPDTSLANLTPWAGVAEQQLVHNDSLRLIGGITRAHAKAISRGAGVSSLTEFADMPHESVRQLVKKGLLPMASVRLHKQAAMQVKTRRDPDHNIAFEFAAHLKLSLPHVSPLDIFFDMEGYPLFPNDGLEYLFGVHCSDGDTFKYWWAHSRECEEDAFIQLMHWMKQRFQHAPKQPQPRIYHYGHYEVTALRRIAFRAKTSAGMQAGFTLEHLLEHGYFYDVYKFVRASLVIGEPSYSIKTVEKLAGVSRDDDDLADAESSVGLYFQWRMYARLDEEGLDEEDVDSTDDENTAVSGESHPILTKILDYNRRDCESLEQVLQWIRSQRNSDHVKSVDDQTGIKIEDKDEDKENGIDEEEKTQQNTDDVLMPGTCGRTLDQRVADSNCIRRSQELSEQLLLRSVAIDKASILPTSAAQTLAHVLHFYVRESSPDRRLFRDRVQAAAVSNFDAIFNDDKCVAGVRYIGSVDNPDSSRKGACIHVYDFNASQTVGLSENERVALVFPSAEDRSSIFGFYTVKKVQVLDGKGGKGRIYLTGGGRQGTNDNNSSSSGSGSGRFGVLVSSDALTICDAPLRQSVLRKAEDLLSSFTSNNDNTGNDVSKLSPTSQLLLSFVNRCPVVEDEEKDAPWIEAFRNARNDSTTVATFLASRRKPGVFVIQGPPGTGKTRLSGEVISKLVNEHGKTAAVTSNSHAAIDNLLCSVVSAGVNADFVFKVGTKIGDEESDIGFKRNVRDVTMKSLSSSIDDSNNNDSDKDKKKSTSRTRKHQAVVVGATCYQLCREESDGKFDILFIDEASQVPMAHVVAMLGCARYVVLVGDQRQLQMPVRGSHPGGAGQSCLAYTVGDGVVTVDAQRGIFLRTSFRMNAALCSLVSESFYAGALHAADCCSGNVLRTRDGAHRSGLWFINSPSPPSHSNGSKWHSEEEVYIVSKCIDRVLGCQARINSIWKPISLTDIIVVAPYNAQVRALRNALHPTVRVGTVDKFQGQQAAVAVISTCTSASAAHDEEENESSDEDAGSGKDSHRGLKFCMQQNRLNVAMSRAQCVAIVTGDADAWKRVQLRKVQDVEMAALYRHLVRQGGATHPN